MLQTRVWEVWEILSWDTNSLKGHESSGMHTAFKTIQYKGQGNQTFESEL